MTWRVYLSGEIHSNWRSEIIQGVQNEKLPIEISTPVTDHPASDNVGVEIMGEEEKSFWKDHKGGKVNAIRIKTLIEKSDIVVVKFGDKYRQWNAAFDAGYAAALGKKLIVMHQEEHTHALKEVDASAYAVVENTSQIIEILKYVTVKE